MRTLITDATGRVGDRYARRQLALGQPIRVLVHTEDQAADWWNRGAEVIVGELCDTDAVKQAVSGVDAIVHLAAFDDDATAGLAEAARDAGVSRLVCVSTNLVDGPEHTMSFVTMDCLFCRIVSGEIPATLVRETDTTLAFRDITPKAVSHILVVPKEHYVDVATLAQADAKLAGEVLETVAIVAEHEGLVADGFRVIFNTGEYAGQEVSHVHAHVLGGEPLGPMLAK